MRAVIIMTMTGSLASGLALAEAGKFADPQATTSLPVSGVSSVGYVTVALAIVLALIYGAAWLLRRVKTFSGNAKQSLTVVEAISVGAKERVVLVRVKNQHVLLGVAPGRVNLLLDMGKVEEGAQTDPAATHAASQLPTFKALLKRSMGLS